MSIEDRWGGIVGWWNNQGIEFNDVETDPLGEEQCGDSEDNIGEPELNPVYIGMVFGEEEAYKAYNHTQYWKDSEYVKARLLNPG